ncbi:hypothetical protein HPB52_004828 [Rhipicephalus sanguineus]|uniref:DNA 3'-5' helicase n=1 Tax=Rhipicephalus sanguineus TaxID=34632 RepID=A0A9D4PUH4_RHISA|nr:hypothetical protein HPB52_004828 [Rhipicephalus sanguineus]
MSGHRLRTVPRECAKPECLFPVLFSLADTSGPTLYPSEVTEGGGASQGGASSESPSQAEYEAQGLSVLESSLLRSGLAEHLNAELVLGSLPQPNLSGCLAWIRETFLYVRLLKNPEHYVVRVYVMEAFVQRDPQRSWVCLYKRQI